MADLEDKELDPEALDRVAGWFSDKCPIAVYCADDK